MHISIVGKNKHRCARQAYAAIELMLFKSQTVIDCSKGLGQSITAASQTDRTSPIVNCFSNFPDKLTAVGKTSALKSMIFVVLYCFGGVFQTALFVEIEGPDKADK